jgi:hypothetical protein
MLFGECGRLKLPAGPAALSLAGTRHWQVGQIEPATGATVTVDVTDAGAAAGPAMALWAV